MNFSPSEDPRPEINMVPMVDIILQLVIFFMVTTTFALHSGLDVKLPQAKTQDVREPATLTITLTKDDKLYLDQAPVTIEELPAALAQKGLPAGRENMLIIRADREVPHGKVVHLMDVAKSTGINHLAIATEPAVKP